MLPLVVRLLHMLPWEVAKEWCREHKIGVPIAICAALLLIGIGWFLPGSPRRALGIAALYSKRKWRRLLSRVLGGPQVVLKYGWDGAIETVPLLLRNNSNDVGYQVHISSLYIGFHHITFNNIDSVLMDSPVRLDSSVVGLKDRTLGSFFEIGNRSRRQVPVFLEYIDAHQIEYETKCEIVYNGLRVEAFFCDWGRRGTIDRSEGMPPPPMPPKLGS
jgi:hypothetical protein